MNTHHLRIRNKMEQVGNKIDCSGEIYPELL